MACTRITLPGFSAETLSKIQHVPGMVYRAAYTPESSTAAALAYGNARSAE